MRYASDSVARSAVTSPQGRMMVYAPHPANDARYVHRTAPSARQPI